MKQFSVRAVNLSVSFFQKPLSLWLQSFYTYSSFPQFACDLWHFIYLIRAKIEAISHLFCSADKVKKWEQSETTSKAEKMSRDLKNTQDETVKTRMFK